MLISIGNALVDTEQIAAVVDKTGQNLHASGETVQIMLKSGGAVYVSCGLLEAVDALVDAGAL